jgi:hypothetical protein
MSRLMLKIEKRALRVERLCRFRGVSKMLVG